MTELRKTDFLIEVAKGNVLGHSLIHKFGASDNITNGGLTPVCFGDNYQTPTSTVTLAVISDDALDTALGNGAREVTLEYLDSNFAIQTGTIATNGTTESTGTVSGVLRLLRAYVSSSGTYATQSSASQKGTITIQVSGGGATWAVIPDVYTPGSFGAGQSLIGCYTVPAGKTAYILTAYITIDSSKEVSLYFFKREQADQTSSPYPGIMRIQNLYIGLLETYNVWHRTAEAFPEKTDIGFLAYKTSAGTANVSVEFEVLLIDN